MAKIANSTDNNKHYPRIKQALQQDEALFKAFNPFFQKFTLYQLFNDFSDIYSYVAGNMERDYTIVELMNRSVEAVAILDDLPFWKREDLFTVLRSLADTHDRLGALYAIDDAFSIEVPPSLRGAAAQWRKSLFTYIATRNQWDISAYS